MLHITPMLRIYVYARLADMRKGISALSGVVREAFGRDPTGGSLFVFINRRRDRMKILFFQEVGFWPYYRLLEVGTFERLIGPEDKLVIELDGTQLAMLLSGISLVGSMKRRKRLRLERGSCAA